MKLDTSMAAEQFAVAGTTATALMQQLSQTTPWPNKVGAAAPYCLLGKAKMEGLKQ